MVKDLELDSIIGQESTRVDYTDLMSKCLKNDKKAQEELYNVLSPKMYGVILRYAANQKDTEEILQDSFIEFFNLINTGEQESPELIIKRIVHNRIMNHYEELIRSQLQDVFYPHKDEEADDIIQDTSKEDLLPLIQSLPDLKRIVYNLFSDGYTLEYISKNINTTEFAVRNYIDSAKNELRKKIRNEPEFLE